MSTFHTLMMVLIVIQVIDIALKLKKVERKLDKEIKRNLFNNNKEE